MKFQPRRFVVEVKRGTSRAAFASPDTVSDKFSNAEDMLFGGSPKQTTDAGVFLAAAAAVPEERRILRSLIEPPAPTVPDLPDPPRRGRKPGSKNKPKPFAAMNPAAEGRALARPIQVRDLSAPSGFAGDAPVWQPPAINPAGGEALAVAASSEARDRDVSSAESKQGQRIRLRDRSNILKRYVLGTEARPGQPGYLRARRAARAAASDPARLT